MSVTVRVTRPAAAELERILAFLHKRSPQASSRFERKFADALMALSEFPDRTRATSMQGIRVFNTQPFPYLIFIRRRPAVVEVIAIPHGARNPRTMPGIL